ncbi:MAG: DUF2878 domain-containing protein [bacterium]
MKNRLSLVDFVLFNICWGANVLSSLYSLFFLGPIVVALSVILHLILIDGEWTELGFLIVLSTIGYLWDTVISGFGIIGFPGIESAALAPFWLFAQWVAFGLLFRHSIRWLRQRHLLAGLFGALGGPLSYYSAARLNVLTLGSPLWQSLLVMALGWSLIVPTFGKFSEYCERIQSRIT